MFEQLRDGAIVVTDGQTMALAHKFFPLLVKFEDETSCRVQAAMDWNSEEDDDGPLKDELGTFALIQKMKREHANLLSIFTKGYSLN